MFTIAILNQYSFESESPSEKIREVKERNPKWKGSKTVTACQWHDAIHRKSWRLTQKILEMVNEFNTAAGYKINMQKYVMLLFTNKELAESEINKTTPFKTF